MMGTTHAASGLAAGLGVGLLGGNPAVALLCGGLGLVTSYLPDLDHPRARAVRALGPLGWLMCRILRGASRALGLPAHRGLSHTAAFTLAVGVAAGLTATVWVSHAVAPWLLGAAAAAGVAAALAGDWVTKASLPHLWWPLVTRAAGPPEALRVTTGKAVEKILILPALVAGCVALATYALTL